MLANEIIVTTSWDDGGPSDVRLAELLQKYNVPATFYIPIDNVERQCLKPQEIREIADIFDVGGHTYHHVDLTRITLREAEKEIVNGKEELEELIDRKLFSFCYPKGKHSEEIINVVKAAGFAGARTTKSCTRNVKDLFRIGTTVHARDFIFTHYIKQAIMSFDSGMFLSLLRKNLFFESWDRIALETLDFVIQKGGIWHLWGHSWEIEDHEQWGKLTNVLRGINSLPDDILKVNNSQLIEIFRDKVPISRLPETAEGQH